MGTPLRVLIVEDSEDDALLLLRELRRGGYEPISKRVDTPEMMTDALEKEGWDIVISDYVLPQFNGLEALRLMQKKGLDLPFVIVSGKAGEDILVGAMKAGVHDYILKDNLARLVPAVERELRDAVVRRERKKAETALRESEERFRFITENISDLVAQISPEGRYLYVSPSYEKTLGYDSASLLGKSPNDYVHPEDVERHVAAIQNGIAQRNEELKLEYRIRHQSGEYRWLEGAIKFLYDENGNFSKVQVNSRDITERKRAEGKIKASLREKEILLKEIHHRVKNNLQIIASLLNLQSRHIKDPQTREMFRESQNRVRSMGLIHERIYRSEDLARIDLAEYLRGLLTHLFSSYSIKLSAIDLKLGVKDIFLGLDTAIPCGLIINELVSNAIKHAFPKGRKGEICISLELENERHFTLKVRDNGVGFPQSVDLRNPETMGLQLVNTLSGQLGGTIELVREGGTEFRITFKA